MSADSAYVHLNEYRGHWEINGNVRGSILSLGEKARVVLFFNDCDNLESVLYDFKLEETNDHACMSRAWRLHDELMEKLIDKYGKPDIDTVRFLNKTSLIHMNPPLRSEWNDTMSNLVSLAIEGSHDSTYEYTVSLFYLSKFYSTYCITGGDKVDDDDF